MVKEMDVEKLEIVNGDFWRDLGVSFDAINEFTPTNKKRYMDVILNSLSIGELVEFSGVSKTALEESDNKKQIKDKLLINTLDNQLVLLLLNDFLKRKKRTISSYYSKHNFDNKYSTPLVQLYEMFHQSPEQLFSILTYHLWSVRGTGEMFTLNKKLGKEKAHQVITEKGFKDELCNCLFKASNEANNYRIFSYVVIDGIRFIGLLYKQIKDTSIPDYNRAVRNKGIEILLFELNVENDTVEIKTKVKFEYEAIKKYIENTFDGILTAYKTEVFRNYNKATVLESLISEKTASGEPVNDFMVEKVIFSSSPIKNSPEVMLHTKNMDVWSSVSDAHAKGAVNAESIKDMTSISFKASNVSRTIRLILKDNGNVIFTMDDSLIDKEIIEEIKLKFFEKFGIPLFQEISNDKFLDGQADLFDYVLGQFKHIDKDEKETGKVYKELVERKFLIEELEKYAICSSNDCPYEITIKEDNTFTNECPLCDSRLYIKENLVAQVSIDNIKKDVKKKLRMWCEDDDWIIHKDSTMTFGKNVFKFIKLERILDRKILQILVVDQSVDQRLLNKLYKMLTPLIIVFVGQQEKFIDKYSNECIQAITFGKIYVQDDNDIKDFFEGIYTNLELRAKNYIASAANRSYLSLQKIYCEPEEIEKAKYSYGDLEDDGYALIKDMFPNSVKWGKEQSGKELPEGVLSLSYIKNGNKKKSYAFSFDFKLTYKNQGYPLVIAEQRKAIQYVNDLNDTDLISSFANLRELSGHIFISNLFNDAQVTTTIKYFEENRAESVRTKPIFITTETLAYLHLRYRENYEEVEVAKNYYLGWIFEMLVNNSHYVTKKHVDRVFDRLLSKEYREIDIINMPLLTDEITEKYIG